MTTARTHCMRPVPAPVRRRQHVDVATMQSRAAHTPLPCLLLAVIAVAAVASAASMPVAAARATASQSAPGGASRAANTEHASAALPAPSAAGSTTGSTTGSPTGSADIPGSTSGTDSTSGSGNGHNDGGGDGDTGLFGWSRSTERRVLTFALVGLIGAAVCTCGGCIMCFVSSRSSHVTSSPSYQRLGGVEINDDSFCGSCTETVLAFLHYFFYCEWWGDQRAQRKQVALQRMMDIEAAAGKGHDPSKHGSDWGIGGLYTSNESATTSRRGLSTGPSMFSVVQIPGGGSRASGAGSSSFDRRRTESGEGGVGFTELGADSWRGRPGYLSDGDDSDGEGSGSGGMFGDVVQPLYAMKAGRARGDSEGGVF